MLKKIIILVDALKVIFQGKKVEPADFSYETNEIYFKIDLGENIYLSKHNLDTNTVSSSLYLQLSHVRLNELKIQLYGDFDETDQNFNRIKDLANMSISWMESTLKMCPY